MRSVTFVMALASACVVSPALAQVRILSVQDNARPPAAQAQAQAAPPARPQAPAQPAPTQKDAQAKGAQTEAPDAPSEGAGKAALPAARQATSQAARQSESQAKRQDRALPQRLGRRLQWARFWGRFGFARVDGGFLRLDRNSGGVAYCTARAGSWSCKAVPEQKPSLDRQIAKLSDEVATLKQEVAALRTRPPHPPSPPHPVPPQTVPPQTAPPAPPSDQHGGIKLKLPSHEDIARARSFIADTWHRLVELIENIQKDLLQGSGGGEAKRVSRT